MRCGACNCLSAVGGVNITDRLSFVGWGILSFTKKSCVCSPPDNFFSLMSLLVNQARGVVYLLRREESRSGGLFGCQGPGSGILIERMMLGAEWSACWCSRNQGSVPVTCRV